MATDTLLESPPVTEPAAAGAAAPTDAQPPATDAAADPAKTGAAGSSSDPVKTPEPAKPDANKPDAPAVPEKYDLKAPEGVDLDASVVEGTAAISRELGLSNEQAQKLLEHQAQVLGNISTAQAEQVETLSQTWKDEVIHDKEFGGDKLPATTAKATRALDRFFPELKAGLKGSPFANHPALIRGLARIGAAMGEDQMVQPGSTLGGEQSVVDILYPTNKS
jgi:hypothetical protein